MGGEEDEEGLAMKACQCVTGLFVRRAGNERVYWPTVTKRIDMEIWLGYEWTRTHADALTETRRGLCEMCGFDGLKRMHMQVWS